MPVKLRSEQRSPFVEQAYKPLPQPTAADRLDALEYRVELMDIALGALGDENARLKARLASMTETANG